MLILILVATVGLRLWSVERDRRLWAASLSELDAEIVGHDYLLYVRYPGRDQQLHTADDRIGTRDLFVPSGARVRVQLRSLDYIYLIEVPELGIYDVAAPELKFEVTFVAPESGIHELLGSQMCGYDHNSLLGKLRVQSADEFVRTMERLSVAPPDDSVPPIHSNEQP